MARLAQAVRGAKVDLAKAARGAKDLRGRMDPNQLKESRAFLVRALRRLPAPEDIEDLAQEVEAGWDPPEAGKDKGKDKDKDKGAKADDAHDDDKKELLRKVLVFVKRTRKVADAFAAEAKQDEAVAMVAEPAEALLRAPLPKERSTAEQMTELLGLIQLFTTLVERYAQRLKG